MTASNPSLDFSRLKKQVSIDQALTAYGLRARLRKWGDQLLGPCPLHGGDNLTAFRVHLRRGLWHCFTRCGGGDLVDLIRIIERCSFADAANHLRRLAWCSPPSTISPGFPIPANTASIASTKPHYRPFRRRIELNPKAPFLQEHKGITSAHAARFDVGIPDIRSSFLRGTIAVRLHDLQGQPLGYCGRRLDPTDIARWGKWRFPRGFPKADILYNAHRVNHARDSGIVIVECPWAVIRLAQIGSPAVALLGTSISGAQIAWLEQAPDILLMLDGDHAGRNAAPKLAKLLGTNRAQILKLPNDQEPEDLSNNDLASLVNQHGSFSLNPSCSFSRDR